MRYKIKNWHDYQHYKDRCPPWIKLHSSLITSEVWVMGNDATRVLMIASMVLASRNSDNDGTFNGDPEYVKRFAYLNSKPDFKPLLDNNFLELTQDASMALADCNTEKRREETEQSRADARCPIEKIVSAYHRLLPNNPVCKVLNTSRRNAIKARWVEAAKLSCKPFGYATEEEGLIAWETFFSVCAESDFLTGKIPPKDGRNTFYATVDFLFSPSGFAKCLENKYHA